MIEEGGSVSVKMQERLTLACVRGSHAECLGHVYRDAIYDVHPLGPCECDCHAAGKA
jgi:hypothetical protein